MEVKEDFIWPDLILRKCASNDQFRCLFGVYNRRAPVRLKRIMSIRETKTKFFGPRCLRLISLNDKNLLGLLRSSPPFGISVL